MRKLIFPSLAMTFLLLSGVTAASALAKPVGPPPVQFAVDGTFSSGPGVAGVPFQGTVTVASFVEEDGQLAVQGTLDGSEALSAPVAVTVIANATASDDAGSGCTVQISTAGTFVDEGFILFLGGSGFTLGESVDSGACRVAARDSSDQGALARALNKVIRS